MKAALDSIDPKSPEILADIAAIDVRLNAAQDLVDTLTVSYDFGGDAAAAAAVAAATASATKSSNKNIASAAAAVAAAAAAAAAANNANNTSNTSPATKVILILNKEIL